MYSFKQTSKEKGTIDSVFFDGAIPVLFEVSEKKL